MFSSLNFLFLTSLGITSWILLCITNQQHPTNNYSEWRQAFEEYKEQRHPPKSGISIDPPLLPTNKSIPLRIIKPEASTKLTENLSDYGTIQYTKNVKSPPYLSYFTREQFSRLSLLCPFILAVFVVYNIMLVFFIKTPARNSSFSPTESEKLNK